MRDTGIIRRIDGMGRIVLPVELRESLGLELHDRVEILTDDDRIVIQKFEPYCFFCGGRRDIREFKGKLICKKCIEKISEL